MHITNITHYIIELTRYLLEQNAEVKTEKHETLVKQTIPFYLDKFEEIVAENDGHFVNGKVTLC